MMPVGEPLIIQVQYLSPDGSVEDGPRISVPGAGGRRVRRGKRRLAFVATDNAGYTGQYSSLMAKCTREGHHSFFRSKLVILRWSDLIVEQYWRALRHHLAFGHFSCDKVSSASRRTSFKT